MYVGVLHVLMHATIRVCVCVRVQVGHNGFLMLDFAPNKDGLINPDQVERYAELGAWIRGCYDHPLASWEATGPTATATVSLSGTTGPFDRVVIRENQTAGQRIRGYDTPPFFMFFFCLFFCLFGLKVSSCDGWVWSFLWLFMGVVVLVVVHVHLFCFAWVQ